MKFNHVARRMKSAAFAGVILGPRKLCLPISRRADHCALFEQPRFAWSTISKMGATFFHFLAPNIKHALLKPLKDHIDINYVVPTKMVTGRRSACHSAESLLFMNIVAWGPQFAVVARCTNVYWAAPRRQ